MKKRNGKWFLGVFLVGIALFLTGCNEGDTENHEGHDVYTLGDTFVFDDLEITIGDQIGWTNLEDGTDVFYVPMTITNLLDYSHSLISFYWDITTPDATHTDCINDVFDGSVYWMGEIPPGEVVETNMYLVFEENGEYRIEFGDYDHEFADVVITVEK